MATPAAPRLRRSVLYVPGSSTRALAKVALLPADVFILDLEDAVLPAAKEAAREAVAALVPRGAPKGPGPGPELVIRVNGLDTPWGAGDLAMVARSGADAVLLPKVSHAGQVQQALIVLAAAGAPVDLPLWIMAETPAGVLGLPEILTTAPRIRVVVLGTEDLARSLRVGPDLQRTGLLPALGACVLAARNAGLDILDGVFADLDDGAGLRTACRQGKALGFDGKTLIHPGQIATANEVFGVSAAQAAAAAEIISAWEAAAAQGKGVTVAHGRLVERLHVEDARRLLALHQAATGRAATGGPPPQQDVQTTG